MLAGKLGWGFKPLLERDPRTSASTPAVSAGSATSPQERMPGLLGGASLFVYPSLAEGFGFPPLEAMACGVPDHQLPTRPR